MNIKYLFTAIAFSMVVSAQADSAPSSPVEGTVGISSYLISKHCSRDVDPVKCADEIKTFAMLARSIGAMESGCRDEYKRNGKTPDYIRYCENITNSTNSIQVIDFYDWFGAGEIK